jgi:hypothetical protein
MQSVVDACVAKAQFDAQLGKANADAAEMKAAFDKVGVQWQVLCIADATVSTKQADEQLPVHVLQGGVLLSCWSWGTDTAAVLALLHSRWWTLQSRRQCWMHAWTRPLQTQWR